MFTIEKEFISVRMAEIMPVIQGLLLNNNKAKLIVTGNSMYPFLRHGIDSVFLSSKETAVIKKGTIVLFLRENGQYVLHRIKKLKKTSFFIVGDAQTNIEGPLDRNQIVAVVTSVYRGNKEISCKSFSWRFLSILWLSVLPFRYYIIKSYLKLRKIFKKIFIVCI